MIPSGKNTFAFDSLKKRPLILDGAMGSLLQQKGYDPDCHIWMTELNRSSPEMVIDIHKSYIEAGADIITTNTFRTNPASLEAIGVSNSAPYVQEAVNLAMDATKDFAVYIAGSNAPAEDCYQKERKLSYKQLEINHKKHINLLMVNGVHFILNETQSHFDEIRIICKHCSTDKIPFILSIYFDNNLKILSGEPVIDVVKFCMEHDPLAIGFNCVAPELLYNLLAEIETNFEWGFYLNCGRPNYYLRRIKIDVNSNQYVKIAEFSMQYDPAFIGACCGSTPDHIRAIKKFLDEKNS